MTHSTAAAPPALQVIANRLRRDSLVSTHKAGSGHPTSCLSCAELMATLFFERIRLDVSEPHDLANDHFVLSKGHAAPILWAVLKEAGVLSSEDHDALRDFDSTQEGHPTPRNNFIDVATGSLGQGLSAGLGIALLDQREGRDNRTFVLCGDGEMAEGSVWEAINLAGHIGIPNLKLIVDVNGFGQTGQTMLRHDIEGHARRISSFGWEAILVEDGHDIEQVREGFGRLEKVTDKPAALVARTVKGKGVKELEGEAGSHGKPAPDLQAALDALPADEDLDSAPAISPPDRLLGAPHIADIESIALPLPEGASSKDLSPRKAFGMALEELVSSLPNIFVLDGDVGNSTYTEKVKESQGEHFSQCYIAEQNMVGMAAGLARHGKQPFVATFAAFLSRAFDQIRMAAISRANITFAGTHAGIATGEDGPSQMGLEDLALFRSIPHSIVLQPCDTVSVFRCMELASIHSDISYLRLFRPDVSPIYATDATFRIGGSNTVMQGEDDKITIVASGITTHYALKAAGKLAKAGLPAEVIDCYCIKPIDEESLRKSVNRTKKLVVVEDHYPQGGLADATHAALGGMSYASQTLCVSDVPRSGSAERLAKEFGIDSDAIAQAARELAS